jgi:hypothetical protein
MVPSSPNHRGSFDPQTLDPCSPGTLLGVVLASFLLAGGFVPVLAQSFDRGRPIDGLELADLATAQVFALADVNGDGFPDIVTAGFDPDNEPAVIVLLNDRGGGFGAPAYFIDEEFEDLDDVIAVEVADVGSPVDSDAFGEPDGNPDIIVLDLSAELLIVLWGDGAGSFQFSIDAERFDLLEFLEGEPIGLAVGDFDGDYGSDLVVLDSGGEAGLILFLCNRPRAPFLSCDTSLSSTEGEEPIAAVTGDFDGSGTTDVVVLNSGPGNGNLVLLTGDGRGNFTLAGDPPIPLAQPNVTAMTAARIDGDGIDDVVISYIEELGGDSVQVFRGGARLTQWPVIDGVAFTPVALASGDFDGDGISDLVAAQSSPQNESFVMLGDGEGGFEGVATSQGVLTGPAIAVKVADLDRDGDDDFVVAREDGTGFRIALNARIRPTPTPTEILPTLTPTSTEIGLTGTPTPTGAGPTPTPTPVPSFTPTGPISPGTSPTLTRTSAPTRTQQPSEASDEDDGCNVARTGNGGAGSLFALLAGAILWLARLGVRRRLRLRRIPMPAERAASGVSRDSRPRWWRRAAHGAHPGCV